MTRSRPDSEVVRRHIGAIREALSNLSRHAGCTAAQMRTDADLRWAVERGLQLCAQNVLDIATHIAAAAGMDSPDYSSAIDRLGELGVLPAEFAANLRPIGGFRNVLVHAYLKVDLEIVERMLMAGLEQFETFARHVEGYLDRLPRA